MEKIKEKKRRKILVTGSSGMLGSALCRELSGNYEITGLDTLRRTTDDGRRTKYFIQCDIVNKTKTIMAVVDAKPDLVIHAAAWTDVDGCERNPDKAKKVNEVGTENVAASASKVNVPLVYISTDFVFDGRKRNPYTEDDLPNPISIYAKSKLAGEKNTGELKKYMIVRTSWLFGANGKNFVDAILDKAKNEKELKVVDDQVGSPTYAKDLARAIKKLLTETLRRTINDGRWTNEVYHISNKGAVSWFDYANEILKLANARNVKLVPIKSDQLGRLARRPAFSALDNTKFEKATGFTMRPWQEALAEYIQELGLRIKN